MNRRLELLIIVAVVLLVVVVGGWIRGYQHRQELVAARSASQLSAEQKTAAAIAQNERAMEMNCLPDILADGQ